MTRFLTLALALVAAACSGPPAGDTETAHPNDAASAPAASDDGPVVVFLGTSLTAGLGLPTDEDTYVARVAELADSAGIPIRAVNAGVSGETSAGGLRRIDWVLREPLDVLVIELGANDGLRGQDPFALADNLTQIIRATRTRYPEARIVLAGMEAPPNLGPLYTLAFHDVFPRVAEQESAQLIPFLLAGVAGIPSLNQSDGIHPTPAGHRIMAQTVWSTLGPLLSEMEASR
ncbi:MAG: arylesterase [Gemmatimonadetes bacterium]|nr:arylesterase [Gemmatimonadota bacterium]